MQIRYEERIRGRKEELHDFKKVTFIALQIVSKFLNVSKKLFSLPRVEYLLFFVVYVVTLIHTILVLSILLFIFM